ncbi:MAG: hypothetical protein PHY09_07795 [Desulfuromonadaceae bacterium]|nr:hypothetical protein [Desulfuromonadaceae bacterium]MDD5106627.1 hypothetical protein [Desulfuromonadaceae bacterium]
MSHFVSQYCRNEICVGFVSFVNLDEKGVPGREFNFSGNAEVMNEGYNNSCDVQPETICYLFGNILCEDNYIAMVIPVINDQIGIEIRDERSTN